MNTLTPLKDLLKPKTAMPLIMDGNLIYSERTRSRSIIILKKEIRQELADLYEKNMCVRYRLEYYRYDYDAFEKRIKEILQTIDGMPLLLYLYKSNQPPKQPKKKDEELPLRTGNLIVERKAGKLEILRTPNTEE